MKKQTIKNRDLFRLKDSLVMVSRHPGVKFAYGVVRNLKKVEAEIELLTKTIKPSTKYLEYDKKRIDICIKHSNVVNGKPEFVNGNYIIKDRVKFDKEIEVLRKEYKKVLDEQEKKLKEYNELLEEESEFDPYKISMDTVPQDIVGAELNGIFDLIKE